MVRGFVLLMKHIAYSCILSLAMMMQACGQTPALSQERHLLTHDVYDVHVNRASLSSQKQVFKEPNYDTLADAIRRAEGNSNYGILKHYKHTSYRQACKNTCQHAYKDWLKYAVRAGKGHKMGYLEFLRDRYAPIGANNDPTGLNKNWLKN